jgi:hypothetical protein
MSTAERVWSPETDRTFFHVHLRTSPATACHRHAHRDTPYDVRAELSEVYLVRDLRGHGCHDDSERGLDL